EQPVVGDLVQCDLAGRREPKVDHLGAPAALAGVQVQSERERGDLMPGNALVMAFQAGAAHSDRTEAQTLSLLQTAPGVGQEPSGDLACDGFTQRAVILRFPRDSQRGLVADDLKLSPRGMEHVEHLSDLIPTQDRTLPAALYHELAWVEEIALAL